MNEKIKPILKNIFIIIALFLLIGICFPTWTPSIKGYDNSISVLKQIEVNGTKQEVMIRGRDRNNPVIIFVHGGPGCPEIPYVRKYQKKLEENFTVVQYDQRGSGKSYQFFEDYSNLSVDLLVDDLLALTDYIKKELNTEKIILIGHSFGTNIGIKAANKAPEKYIAYIGIGQVADTVQSELDALNFCIMQAKIKDSKEDSKELENYREKIQNKEAIVPRKFIYKYGGAARLVDDKHDYLTGFLMQSEYNLFDTVRFLIGTSVSCNALRDELLNSDTTKVVPELKIPCYFVSGKYDYMTSMNAAQIYLQEIKAPEKEFVVFEQSAHYPQFEEKEEFAHWLNSKEW